MITELFEQLYGLIKRHSSFTEVLLYTGGFSWSYMSALKITTP